jgi:AcrR family transcriptional regulator
VSSGLRKRDAARSRQAILDAAEEVFALRGYAATTMQEIAETAGVARATPGYFFRSKETLYGEVLRRVHDGRSAALAEACAPLQHWAADERAGVEALRASLAHAVDGYVSFLEARPAFARLIEWESLTGAAQLEAQQATSFTDAFRAVHRVRRARGLRDFDVAVVVVALVSLCFLPVAHAKNFLVAGGVDPLAAPFRERYQAQVVESVLAMLVAI